jgi:hypothetical protein
LLPWLLIPTLGPILVACIVLLTGRRSTPDASAGVEGATVAAEERAGDKGDAGAVSRGIRVVPASRDARDVAAARERRAEAAARESREASAASGLKLLATLQEEARLLDFVREDITGYSDEQVGAAVRGIHAALRKAIDERLEMEPILPGDEGDPVEVPAAMPAGHLRVSGRAVGAPPFRGVLRHGGWRATAVRLPAATPGSDPSVLAPAEVEVGEE